MKMAKASQKDIEAAGELMGILDAISRGQYPATEDEDDAPYHFDQDKFEHLQRFYERVSATLDKSPGYPGRIIGGMCYVIMWDKNEIIDPDADTIELHPKFARIEDERDAAVAATAKIEAQRNELLAALKAIAEFDQYEPAGPAAARAKAAIAEVEGQAGG